MNSELKGQPALRLCAAAEFISLHNIQIEMRTYTRAAEDKTILPLLTDTPLLGNWCKNCLPTNGFHMLSFPYGECSSYQAQITRHIFLLMKTFEWVITLLSEDMDIPVNPSI